MDTATGVGALKRTPPARAAMGCAVRIRASTALAAEVPSVPQAGQVTGAGTRPWTGSTSKA